MTEIRVVKPTPADVEAALQSPFYKGYLAGQRSSPAPAFSGFSDTVDRSYLCPHDLDLRLHARCYLCEPEVKEPT